MRQTNERNIDLIHSSRNAWWGGGERGKKNINFPLKDSNLRPSDFTIWSFFKLSRQWAMKYSGYIKDHPPYCWDHQCRTFYVLKYIMMYNEILETLWSCHGESRKWKFEKIVTLFRGRMTEKNVYHTKYADWYRQSVAAYHSPFATLYWVSNKVALKVVCKGVWCLYNRRNSTWLLVDIATSLRRKGIFMIASVLH